MVGYGWIRIYLRIWIQEAKMSWIHRFRILSAATIQLFVLVVSDTEALTSDTELSLDPTINGIVKINPEQSSQDGTEPTLPESVEIQVTSPEGTVRPPGGEVEPDSGYLAKVEEDGSTPDTEQAEARQFTNEAGIGLSEILEKNLIFVKFKKNITFH